MISAGFIGLLWLISQIAASSAVSVPLNLIDGASEVRDLTCHECTSSQDEAPPGFSPNEQPAWSMDLVKEGFLCFSPPALTCEQAINYPNASMLWRDVRGHDTLLQIDFMLEHDLRVCDECFGYEEGTCKSKNPSCLKGLSSLATTSEGTRRYDRAIAHYGQYVGHEDFSCEAGSSNCLDMPDCFEGPGPRNRIGAWAIIKSMTTIHAAFEVPQRAVAEAVPVLQSQADIVRKTFGPPPPYDPTEAILDCLTIFAAFWGLTTLVDGKVQIFNSVMATLGITLAKQHISDIPKADPPTLDKEVLSIFKVMGGMYVVVNDNLFQNGSYTSLDGSVFSLEQLMQDGASMERSDAANDTYPVAVKNLKKLVMQQLIFATWMNYPDIPTPFIAFDNTPCEDVDFNDGLIRPWNWDLPERAYRPFKDVGTNHNGKCYYLLMAQTEGGWSHFVSFTCETWAFPHGTNHEMADHHDDFDGLGLADFVVGAVDWFNMNHQQNDNLIAWNSEIAMLPDHTIGPRTPGVLNIPICDYLGGNKTPGIMCPKLFEHVGNQRYCNVYPSSEGVNLPGTWNAGQCRVHVQDYSPMWGDQNPTKYRQLAAQILDTKGRVIANMAKEVVIEGSVKLEDSPLPAVLTIAPPAKQDGPLRFWYENMFWDSTGEKCSQVNGDGVRTIECYFSCDKTAFASTTAVGGIMPPTPIAIPDIGETKYHFTNTYRKFDTPATTTAHVPPSATAWVPGQCHVHITQIQRNEDGLNENNNFEVEVYLSDGKNVYKNSTGQVALYAGHEVDVFGDGSILRIRADKDYGDYEPLHFQFGSIHWTTNDKPGRNTRGWCYVGEYDSGKREMDCNFICKKSLTPSILSTNMTQRWSRG